MRLRAVLLCIAVIGTTPGTKADPRPTWAELRSLYDSGQVEEAVRLLEQNPPERPTQTPEYFFNLGTAYFRLGRFGKAVAYLEKAHKILPTDPDIRKNLNLAKTRLSQTLGSADRLDPASTHLESAANAAAIPEIRAALAVGALLLLVLGLRRYLGRGRSIQGVLMEPSRWLAAAGLLLLLVIGILEFVRQSRPTAVSLIRITIRSGPGEQFLEMGSVEAGVKLRLLGPSERAAPRNGPGSLWFQVRYVTGGVGWVPDASILVL